MVQRSACQAFTALATFHPSSAGQLRFTGRGWSREPWLQTQRAFSTTSHRLADEKTHYDVLGLNPSATPADIKKSFYALSRETHPDIHPNDPTAGTRFSSISESYHVLSDPEKRKRYDRDVIHVHHRHGHGHGHGHHGAPHGHRGSYAGSRPPSGLSKRRGAFRGPPPSFYAQGGYGSTSNRNTASGGGSGSYGTHEDSQPGPRPNESSRANQNEESTGPRPFTDQSPNYDFNAGPVRRTQTAEDNRRISRRQAALAAAQAEAANAQDFWVRVVVVMGIFVGAAALGGVMRREDNNDRQGENRKNYVRT